MKMKMKEDHLDSKKVKQFAALFSILLITSYCFSNIVSKGSSRFLIVLGVVIILNLFAWIKPKYVVPFFVAWIFLGEILGKINSKIILGVLFVFVIIPYSLFYKLLKKDPMKRKFEKFSKSYRQEAQVINLSGKHY